MIIIKNNDPLQVYNKCLAGLKLHMWACVCREQIELCVDILERILMAHSPVSLVQNYRVELQAGLTHPNEMVKLLALTQVGCSHT